METAIEKSKQTALAKRDPASEMIAGMEKEWGRVLPKFCTPERFARMALSCIRKNPKLALALNTKEGKVSLMSAFMTCAELGLEPDGRKAHLIPYKETITLIIDYKGLAELIMRSGLVSNIHADKICDKDVFVVDRGLVTKHEINYKEDRGRVYAYYCIIRLKDGSEKSEVMTMDEIVAVSKRSKSVQNYDKCKSKGEWAAETPWQTDFNEMAKKTVFKRAAKWMPLSPEVKDAIEQDDADYIPASQPSRFDVQEYPIEATVEAETTETEKKEIFT